MADEKFMEHLRTKEKQSQALTLKYDQFMEKAQNEYLKAEEPKDLEIRQLIKQLKLDFPEFNFKNKMFSTKIKYQKNGHWEDVEYIKYEAKPGKYKYILVKANFEWRQGK